MYYLEKSEFIEAIYYIYFSTYKNKEKLLEEIFTEYDNFVEKDEYFEKIYKELTTNNFNSEVDYNFLYENNGKMLTLKYLLSKKVLVHRFSKHKAVKKILLLENFKCVQCGTDSKKYFFKYKNSFKEDGYYCTVCSEFGVSNNITYSFLVNFDKKENYDEMQLPKIKLSAEQSRASKILVDNSYSGKNSLIWAVCGAGKTEIIYETIYNHLKAGKKICLAIPRKDIVKELARRIKKDFKISLSVICGDYKKIESNSMYIMTTHQLVNYYNYFDLIIVDEVDAFPYSGDSVLEHSVMKSRKENSPLIFLSATPSAKIKKFVDDIYKIPIRYHRYLLPTPTFKINNKLNKVLLTEELISFINSVIERKRRALIFVPTIKIGEELYEILKKEFHDILYVDSTDSKREIKIAKFRNWECNFLITTTILERGVTFDYIDVLVYKANHENFTKESLIQIAGRVGRKSYDPTGEIIFLCSEKNKAISQSIKEIEKMNELAKYRKLNR